MSGVEQLTRPDRSAGEQLHPSLTTVVTRDEVLRATGIVGLIGVRRESPARRLPLGVRHVRPGVAALFIEGLAVVLSLYAIQRQVRLRPQRAAA
jgi:hypothetical protein